MVWRLPRSDFVAGKGEGNRREFRKLVKGGAEPGILAYEGSTPVGWCAVAPREVYVALGRSRILRPVDERPVWSISCFFIKRGYRGRGLSQSLLVEAVKFAKKRGAKIVEGYPVAPKAGRQADAFVWVGLASTFEKAGFEEGERRSPSRPIMRLFLKGRGGGRR